MGKRLIKRNVVRGKASFLATVKDGNLYEVTRTHTKRKRKTKRRASRIGASYVGREESYIGRPHKRRVKRRRVASYIGAGASYVGKPKKRGPGRPRKVGRPKKSAHPGKKMISPLTRFRSCVAEHQTRKIRKPRKGAFKKNVRRTNRRKISRACYR